MAPIKIRQFSGNRVHVDFLDLPRWMPEFEFDFRIPSWIIVGACRLILFMIGVPYSVKRKE